jgi:hypothetical protein
MSYPVPYTWFISGKITYLNGSPFTTGIIRAFHVSNGTLYYLGESGFNYDGSYQITYSSANFQNGNPTIQHPNVKIKVFDYQGNVIWESRNVMAFECQQTFSFIIDKEQEDEPGQQGTQDTGNDNPGNINPGNDNPSGDNPPQEIWKIAGTVAYDNGQLLTTGIVKAFDYYGDSNHYLSSAVIKFDGTFEILYTKDSFQRGDLDRTAPNLVLCVYDLAGKWLSNFDVNNPPAQEEYVSIVIAQEIPKTEDNYVVYGRVVNHSGHPLENVLVKAVCLDFVNAETVHAFKYYPLNSVSKRTDENGYYEIIYSPSCLPHRNQPPSSENSNDKFSLFAKFFLDGENNTDDLSDNSPAWNYSNLVLDASRRQEINFVLDSASTVELCKFDSLEKSLKAYLKAVIWEPACDANKKEIFSYSKKLQLFVESSYKNLFPGFRENLNQEDVSSYFMAYSLICGVLNLSPEQLDEKTFIDKASCFYALCKKGFDSISKLRSASRQDVQDCLLEAITQSLIPQKTDVSEFVVLWEGLQGLPEFLDENKVNLGIKDILASWAQTVDETDDEAADDGNPSNEDSVQLALNGKIDTLLKKFYDSEADVESFLENVRPSETNTSLNDDDALEDDALENDALDDKEKENVSLDNDEYSRLKLVFDLKNFFEDFYDGIDKTYKAIVKAAKNQSAANGNQYVEPSLKVLLDFTDSDWDVLVEEISKAYRSRSGETKLALPVTFPGTTDAEQKSLYRIKLQKLITSWLPQDALLLKLSRIYKLEDSDQSNKFDYDGWKAIGKILLSDERWKEFSLDGDFLDDYIESRSVNVEKSLENYINGLDEPEKSKIELSVDNFTNYVRTLQRLYRLTTDFDSIFYLLQNAITSAYQITQDSEEEFVAEHHVGLVTMENARQIYCLAAQYTSEASMQMAKYYGSLTEHGETLPPIPEGMDEDSYESLNLEENSNVAPSRINQPVIANWKNLFGVLNRNAAAKGQSVLSPSAYLMDLLDFLKGDGFKILKARRPDIWNLELTKENAETALPTIDIVVEILEQLAAENDLGNLDCNTDSASEAQLRAEPAFAGVCNDEAYAKLMDGVYPMDLPRNFHAEKMTALLKNVSLSVNDLIQAQKNPGSEYRFTTLRLSPTLIKALQLSGTDLFQVYELWGLNKNNTNVLCPDKATVVSGSWQNVLSNASIFLNRSGLSMKEFQEIKSLPAFSGDGADVVPISNTHQLGDINAFRIVCKDSELFARKISRFVRLKRLLGWNIEDVSLVFDLDLKTVFGLEQDSVDSLNPQEVNRLKLEAIDRVAHLKTLTSASVREILAWCSEMSQEHFSEVFPNDSDSIENESADDIQCRLLETASVSLGINQDDLQYALELDKSSFSANDFVKNLKMLYRISTFAKRLGISVQKYELLRILLKEEPAKNWNLKNCIRSWTRIKDILNSPLDEDSLVYLALPLSPSDVNKSKLFVESLKVSLENLWKTSKSEKLEEIENNFPDMVKTPESRAAFYKWVEQNINDFANSQNLPPLNDIQVLCQKESLAVGDLDTIKTSLLGILGNSYNAKIADLFTEESLNDNVWAKEIIHILAYAESAKNEVLEKLTSEFGLEREVCKKFLYECLGSVREASSETALFDWLGISEFDNDSKLGEFAYALLAKSALIYSYTKMTDFSGMGLEGLYHSFPLNAIGCMDEDDWTWEKYPAREQLLDGVSPLPSALDKLNFYFVISKYFGSSWIYDKLSSDDLSIDFLMEKWNVNERQLKEILGTDVDEEISVPSLSDTEAWMQLCKYWTVYKKAPIDMETLQILVADDLLVSNSIGEYCNAVEKLNESLKSKRSPSDWHAFITPVSDALRKSRRDALVSYICFRSQNDDKHFPQKFFDSNDIYSYYLIDVEMEPEMSVSRTRQALNSIQQFVSRVELGLEGSFILNDEQRRNWEWMRNYRVWEANRKVFLYAENWIESDLRDDKSPFFKELEDEIRQVGDDPKAMHTALGNYLEKMYETSGVEILGACKEDGGGDGILYTLHVIGRTRGEPHHFYIRKYKAKALYSGEWEPWESLDLDIKAEVVLPVLMNQRLYVVWPTFIISKKENGAESSGSMDVINQVEIRLNWSYFNGSKWSSVKTTKNALFDFYARERDIFLEDGEKIDYRYHFQVESGSSEYVQVNVFRSYFEDISKEIKTPVEVVDGTTLEKTKIEVVRDKNRQYIQETGSIQIWVDGRDSAYPASSVTSRDVSEFPPGKCYLERNCWVERDKHVCGYDGLSFSVGSQILQNTPGLFRVLPINFAFYTGEDLPFFYMDSQHSFLVHKVPGDNSTEYQFDLISHPLVAEFYKRYRDGGDEQLFKRETQALPVSDSYYYSYSYYNYYFSVYLGYYIAGDWEAWDLGQSLFSLNYKPSAKMIARPYPVPMIDFSFGTSNAIYNWELFFHVPMLLAEKMFQEQNYEEALKWYRMVFDPRLDLSEYEITRRWSRSLPKGSRFWRFLPFFANRNANDSILETISKPTKYDLLPNVITLQSLVDKWKRDPFNPHLIARYRMAAYQKFVVMKYLDNLIAWADELFTQDTMESVNEAIQLYVLAAEVLGPRNIEASDCWVPNAMTVDSFLKEKKGAIANVYASIEDSLVTTRIAERNTKQSKPSDKGCTLTNVFSSVFYFSIPRNDKLLGYWDTVADRLYKIRNSLNIDGVKRTLALYEPPIDPALLVRARAAGVSIADALSESSAPLPLYRFQVMLQKALDVTHELQSLSGVFLSALEKNDSEALSLMRTRHEQEILALSRELKDFQVKDLSTQLESLEINKKATEIRYEFYRDIKKISDKEKEALALQDKATRSDKIALGLNVSASAMSAIPDLNVGGLINMWGGPELSSNITGGSKISSALSHTASSLQIAAGIIRSQANQIQTMAGYERRYEEWKLQEKLAEKEIANLEKQIVALNIRIDMAEKEIANLERQIEQMDEIYEFMTERFTNQDLYSWMVTQLGQLHSSFFKMALKLAKRAESCYRFELGLKDNETDFIKNDYWDGLRKGLLAGDRLLFALRTMESSYLEKNKRELEITRAVPLSLIDAEALIKLQTEGVCDFHIPETLFDLDFAGQTFRRIRGVQMEIHCNASVGMGVNAKLSMTSNRIRVKPIAASYSDSEDYLPSRIGITTIATSQAEAYAGVFNFDFRDERYLPFEGAGVDSSWRLELPKEFRQFEYESISDVVLRISYTARNGAAENVKQNIINDWGTKKSAIRLSAIDSGALERLQNGETISIKFMKSHFPAIARVEGLLNGLEVYCRFKEGCSAAKMTISSNEVQISNGVIGDSEGPFTLWGGDACSVASGYNISITPDDDTTLTGVEDLIFVHEYTLGKII